MEGNKNIFLNFLKKIKILFNYLHLLMLIFYIIIRIISKFSEKKL